MVYLYTVFILGIVVALSLLFIVLYADYQARKHHKTAH